MKTEIKNRFVELSIKIKAENKKLLCNGILSAKRELVIEFLESMIKQLKDGWGMEENKK